MLVDIHALKVALGGQPILSDVHLTLNEGEIYGLVGPNGAGKSTTIAATLGLLKHQGGSITVLGKNPSVDARAIHARCGVLPEQNGFYDWMTATEYLSFFAELYGHERTAREIEEHLMQVGLEPRPGQPIGTFSRGMRQRLGLARALIGNPQLLILDEPTNGLDPRGRSEIHDILIAQSRRGVGVLLCTHLLDDVDRLCHRIGIIVHGRTVAEGSIAELVRTAESRPRFRLRMGGEPPAKRAVPEHVTVIAEQGEWWIVDIAATISPDVAWRELLFAGWPIQEIHSLSGSLEELYLNLTEEKTA